MRRRLPCLLVLLVAAFCQGGCIDFDLEGRNYRCDGDDTVCRDGWQCGVDALCVQIDASIPGDAPSVDAPLTENCTNGIDDDGDSDVDCLDSDCGPSPCEDTNPCTTDVCEGTGSCTNAPLSQGASCGAGCTCETGGIPNEVACGDGNDNDGDGDTDCNDEDCPSCMGGLMCCPAGLCLTSCI